LKLPNANLAVIPEAKIVRYLLNVDHPRGGSKAIFFMRFGFQLENWQQLRQALLDHATVNEVKDILITEEGTQYTLEGGIQSPDGRNPLIRSVWVIDADSDFPRFITAFPIRRAMEE
jgi:hypothetical protein